MAVFQRDQERVFELEGNRIAGLATPSRQSADVEVWRTFMSAGASTPPHRHDRDEVVVVLTGEGHATVGDREVRFRAGDTVILPAGVVHRLYADTESEAIAAMPGGSAITSPDGEPLDLPWRA